jgi:hypothetical protein
MDKHGKPKKFVLVKYEWSEGNDMFVLLRETWQVYVNAAEQTGAKASVMIAESNDRDELERFRELTKEN